MHQTALLANTVAQKGELKPYRVLSKRSTEGELVKGKALATGIDNPGPRRLGEPERGHLHCRYLVDPLVIGDGAHDHGDLVRLHAQAQPQTPTR